MVIENKGGAGSNIGAEAVARADPDGYTLLIGSLPVAVNRFLYSSLNYDSVTDFAPVSLICIYPNLMVVPNSSPAKSVMEFVAHAKANRGKITFASSGTGTSTHLSGELFKRMTGIEMTHVPYRGVAPALNDVIPGRVDVMFNTMAGVLQQARGGQLRGLAVTSAKRFPTAHGISERGGGRRAGLRCAGVVRVLRAGQDAARDRAQAPRRHGRGAARAGDHQRTGKDRRRRRRLDARRACQASRRPRSTSGVRSSRPPASRPRSRHHARSPPSHRAWPAPRRSRPSPLAPRFAQGWPNRFVKLVVPFTPGGGIDAIGRIIGARLSEMWGQQVVVENKPGAGGNIASEFVARSAPDGYTLYITAGGLAVNRFLYPSINYDPVADFAPVTLICLFPNLLVVPNSSPFRSVGDLIAQAKANPGKLSFASPGHGSSPHMSARAVQVHGRGRHDARALSRRGAGLHRRDRGPRRLHLRGDGVGPSARPVGPVARARREHRQARSRPRRTCRPSPRPACPATTPRRGSRSSCRPRRRPRSSGKCKPTPSR